MPTDNPPDAIKIRVKIGPHEFEAEGPHEIVDAHFRTWQQLIASDPFFAASAAEKSAAAVPAPAPRSALDLFAVDIPAFAVAIPARAIGNGA